MNQQLSELKRPWYKPMKQLINSLESALQAKKKQQETPRFFEIPRLHSELIDDERNQYLLIKGGRGGFKTTSFICRMIEYSYEQRYRDSCFIFAREIAKTINDSVYSIVKDFIVQADLVNDFDIKKSEITNLKTNVSFKFLGFRTTGGQTSTSQINKLKGQHKISLVLFEEAQDLSEEPLNVFLATAVRQGTVKLRHKKQAEIQDLSKTRFFAAMNPIKEADPVVKRFKVFERAGVGKICHLNMMDIVADEPDFEDKELTQQMRIEQDEWFYPHVWQGQPLEDFKGRPWSTHNVTDQGEIISCYCAFLDPSFRGGDYTALAFLGELRLNNQVYIVVWGKQWKAAWDMEPCISECVDLIKKYQPDYFYYESNAISAAPQREYAQHRIEAIPRDSLGNKENRIYMIAAHSKSSVGFYSPFCGGGFLEAVMDYSNESKNDDSPDAAASVIKYSEVIGDRMKY